jgi:ArsR family transcriptional regulator
MAGENKFDLELFFSALADGTRLRLLNLMRDGEVCVCFFADTLGTNDPKISRHLAYLKRAGLVVGRRDGKWMRYKIVRPEKRIASEILDLTLEAIELDPQMKKDRQKLKYVCCAPQTLVRLERGTARAEPQN